MHASRAKLGLLGLRGCLAALALALALSGTANAQDADPTARARSLFNDGLAFADHGDWERAVHRFRAALELRPAANIRFNLAQSLVHLGRYLEAIEEIERVISDDDAATEVRDAADALRISLEPRLGRLIVTVRGDAADTQVTVDGRPLVPELLGVPVPADPGVRIARLLRGAIELDVEEVDVRRGQEARVVVEVPSRAIPTSAAQPQRWDEGWTWAIVISSIVAVTAAGFAIGFAVADPLAANASEGDFGPPILEIE